jgi:hypothetical protein
MTGRFRLFVHRCVRIMIAPGQEAEQIVLNRCLLGGWILNWLVSAIGMRWAGEVLRPGWSSFAWIIALALVAAVPLVLVESLILHLAGTWAGNRGRWDNLVALCGYANVPSVVLILILSSAIPISMRVFGVNRFHLAFMLLCVLAFIVAAITGLVILRHSLTANYGLNARRAWLIAILGFLVITPMESALRMPFIKKMPISIANLLAMPQMPTPPVITAGGTAKHLNFEYAINLQYYRKLAIRRGDVVVFRGRDEHYRMGRILGLPGEQAGLQDGKLVINGAKWTEPWQASGSLILPPEKLSPGEYFISTDERSTSPASNAQFQAVVDKDQILGPVLQTDITFLGWMFDQP